MTRTALTALHEARQAWERTQPQLVLDLHPERDRVDAPQRLPQRAPAEGAEPADVPIRRRSAKEGLTARAHAAGCATAPAARTPRGTHDAASAPSTT